MATISSSSFIISPKFLQESTQPLKTYVLKFQPHKPQCLPLKFTHRRLNAVVNNTSVVEKAEVMYDKYSARSRRFPSVTMKAERLIGGKKPPHTSASSSLREPEDKDFEFVLTQYKVYVGNLAETVTSDSLKAFFAANVNAVTENGNAVSAIVFADPRTSKCSGHGFVTFATEEDADAAKSLNNKVFQGQTIAVVRC